MESNMIRTFTLSAALTATLITIPASAQTSALAPVSAHLKAVSTMQAAFSQVDQRGRTVTGQLSLKRPGKIRFQYQKGVSTLIVANGNSLYYIDYAVKQVQRWPIGNSPLGVLLNPDMDLSKFAKVIDSADPRIVVVQVRDPKHPEYGLITMGFTKKADAPGGLMLQGWTTRDAQGNTTSIRLSNQQFNVPISDKTFIWSDPRPKGPRS
jgi:outer membrane lipoprotein-sorting protein